MTLDHLSGGRLNVGIGAGTDGYDATMLGRPELSPGRRHARFAEFVEVLAQVLAQPRTSWSGDWYTLDEARTVPGCVQRPHPPFVVAANGPKRMRLALDQGAGWVTTTGAPPPPAPRTGGPPAAEKATRFADSVAAQDPDGLSGTAGFTRCLNLEARTSGFGSAEQVVDWVGRTAALGFTDVVIAWPRPEGAMVGDPALIEAVAARLPEIRAL